MTLEQSVSSNPDPAIRFYESNLTEEEIAKLKLFSKTEEDYVSRLIDAYKMTFLNKRYEIVRGEEEL
ncbi:MAG: hypothetical protein ABSG05_03370 [Candidatus Pacearchaeota archaeon]|jgi:hypothetical protein